MTKQRQAASVTLLPRFLLGDAQTLDFSFQDFAYV
jgi:hypothetical protein